MASTPAHDPEAPPQGARGPALADRPLIVLSQDERLLGALHDVDAGGSVQAVGSEIDLATALMARHAGVALLDCTAVATPVAQLTARLHAQFPELVLIVAGGAAEQGLLAAQITDGTVHRFLHQPVSEQRVRLFVEAAWRRHDEGRSLGRVALAPHAAAWRAARWAAAAAVAAVAALAAGGLWYAQRALESPPTPAPPARAVADTELERLLQRAGEALAAGALVAPAGASAADLYREAQHRNPRDLRAASGLEQVIDRLVALGQARLQANRLEDAQQLADQARAISPDNPRVAFLGAQISALRERAVLGKAQRAAASGDVGGALAVLDDAARAGHRSTLATEAREELAQKQLEARQDLRARLLSEARQALAANDPERADKLAAAAGDKGADSAAIAAVHQDALRLRNAAQADAYARLALAFNARLTAGKLVEPGGDSARHFLGQLLKADPGNPAGQQARIAYDARVLDAARSAQQAHDFEAARRWLGEARAAGADAAALAAADAALQSAEQQADAAGRSATLSAPTRTRYVAPEFPLSARTSGIDGWVDVEFVVRPDGTVGDAAIVGAQPVGVFEQSALAAVRRWRYRPADQGGQAVARRTRVRVRFAMQPP